MQAINATETDVCTCVLNKSRKKNKINYYLNWDSNAICKNEQSLDLFVRCLRASLFNPLDNWMHNTTKYAHHHLLSQAQKKCTHKLLYGSIEGEKEAKKKTKLLTGSAIEKKQQQLIASKRKEAETPCKEKRSKQRTQKNGIETKQNWKWIVLAG